MVKYECGLLGHHGTLYPIVSQEWMYEFELTFCMWLSYIVSGKLKVTLGMHMVIHGCDLLGPGTLKSGLSQE